MTNLSLGQKVNIARREAKLKQEDLAEKIGVSSRTIIRFEKDEAAPNLEDIQKIAKATGKQLVDFLPAVDDSKGLTFEIKKFSESQIAVNKIPLISWVSANRFGEANDSFAPADAEEWIYTTAKGERMFALKVKNDCMEPEFREGDRIIVNPEIQPENGDFVVVRDNKNNEATFKQLKKYGKKIILHPLNPKYPDIELAYDKRYVIVGKVVGKDKKY